MSSPEHGRSSNGLERDELSRGGKPSLSASGTDVNRQLGLFQAAPSEEDRIRLRLKGLDIDNLTPLQALSLLAELKREADG